MSRTFAHAVGFDDAPFDRASRGDVPMVGVVMSGDRVEGVLSGRIRRDGRNSTDAVAAAVNGSRFAGHLQVIFLQGIAMGGFNVVDLPRLHALTGLPVIVVARKAPDLVKIEHALVNRVPGGQRKWGLIQKAGPMEPCGDVWVQRAGLTLEEAEEAIGRFALHGVLPEPLRLAHIIGGGLVLGESRGRP